MTTDDIFLMKSKVNDVSQEDYDKAVPYVTKIIEATSRLSYQCFYVIDHYKQNLMFISESTFHFSEIPISEIINKGFDLLLNYIPEQEVKLLRLYNSLGLKAFYNLPLKDRCNFMISCDFHVKIGQKQKLLNNKISPMLLDKYGNPWLSLCSVSFSSYKTAGHIVLKENDYKSYSMEKKRWISLKAFNLSVNEREILYLAYNGSSVKEMCKEMNKSEDSVKFYRKQLFKKLNVSCMEEAITFVSNYKLL